MGNGIDCQFIDDTLIFLTPQSLEWSCEEDGRRVMLGVGGLSDSDTNIGVGIDVGLLAERWNWNGALRRGDKGGSPLWVLLV